MDPACRVQRHYWRPLGCTSETPRMFDYSSARHGGPQCRGPSGTPRQRDQAAACSTGSTLNRSPSAPSTLHSVSSVGLPFSPSAL